MKRLVILSFTASLLLCHTTKAQTFGDIMNKAEKVLGGGSSGSGGGNISGLSNAEVVSGLKQALEIGSKNAGGQLSKVNGYFGNQLVKILMPPEAQKVERALRAAGLGSEVDKAILAMNRAAEDAATKAAPIFVNAIKSMTISDGIGILKGGNGAATRYLEGRTNTQLTKAFRPVIKNSLDKVDATKYWAEVFRLYNQLPMVKKVNTDLTSYVTERALDGLFVIIAQEENKIRQNPSARVTSVLRKVFGAN